MELRDRVMAREPSTLAAVVRSALGQPRAAPLAFTVEPVRYAVTNPISHGLFRVRGSARVDRATREWTAVLKVLRPLDETTLARRIPAAHRDVWTRAYRWDREAQAYASGLLDALGGGLAAPRAYAVELERDEAWLWLEEIRDEEPAWDVARYARAARHLGRWNGIGAVRPKLDHEWLGRDVLRAWVLGTAAASRDALDDDVAWAHPLVARILGDVARRELRRIAAEHEAHLALLDRLPSTIAHTDAFRDNLMSRRGETVAIDWSFVGITAIGVESGHLVSASLFYSGDRQPVNELDEAVFDEYVAGLRDAGWPGEPADVLAGHFAGPVARFSTIGLGLIRAASDPAAQERIAAVFGRTYVETLELLAARTEYISRRAARLRAMMAAA